GPARPSAVGQGAGGIEPAPLPQPVLGRRPVLVAPLPVVLQRLPGNGAGGGERHVGLATVEPGGGEGGDVAVATVLPQQGAGVPQLQVAPFGPGLGSQRTEE